MIQTVRSIDALRSCVRGWRKRDESVALVPTMGALHEGHLTLVRRARELADHTCASIFVNPTQFGPDEDFDSYPREEGADVEKLKAEGVDLVYMPTAEQMYPPNHTTRVRVEALGEMLEEQFRPGFFEGVATVVAKLLLQALPDVAVFGEKDYQQLQIVKRMVRDLDIPVRVEGVPIVREPDGLALSSRNAYLDPGERAAAPTLHRVLSAVADATRMGGPASEPVREATERGRAELTGAGFRVIDYLEVRDAETLEPVTDAGRPARVLAAAWLGRARLIDNVPV